MAVSTYTDPEQILSWVSTHDYIASLKSKLDARLPGTARWVEQECKGVEWLAKGQSANIVWFRDLPGTGVSTLTATIIEHIQENVVEERDAVAYMFASSRLEVNALDILSCICRQLASQCSEMPWQLLKLYAHKAKVDERLDIDEVMLLTVGMFRNFSRVFIIIDGIHEVLEEWGLDILLAKIEWMRNNGANLFISSSTYCDRLERPARYRKIEEAFAHKAICEKPSSTDSKTVISQRLRQHATGKSTLMKHGLSETAFVTRIDEQCGGVFRVAELRLEQELRSLERANSDPGNLPKLSELEAAIYYDLPTSIMKRLPDWQGYIVKEILTWVIFAVVPFNLEQIAFILFRLVYRLQDPPELYNFETLEKDVIVTKQISRGTVLTKLSIIDLCEGLIQVSDDGHIVLSNGGSSTELQKAAGFEGSHFHIAYLSLSLMTIDEVIQSDHEPLWDTTRRAPTINYCQTHWAYHFLKCTPLEQDHLNSGAITYFRMIYQKPKRWIEAHKPMYDRPYDVLISDDETPILKATRFGLNTVLTLLLGDSEYNIDARSWKGETAMSVAVATQNYEAVHKLFCHGASVQSKTKNGDSLLHLAVENDDEVMLALLIKCGLDPNTSDERLYANVIQAAARKNAIRCGSILLHEKIELRGVLEAAAGAGALDFVRLIVETYSLGLISRELELNAVILAKAIESGSAPLVRYLLEQGASVNDQGEMHLSAIHVAAKQGNLDIVKRLKECGADPFALYEKPLKEHEADSAMCECIRKGHTKIIEYLLPLMDDKVSSKSVLSMALAAVYAVPPNIRILRLMLRRIPKSAQHFRRNRKDILLSAAAAVGDNLAMYTILGYNVPIETPDEYGWTALHVAAQKGQLATLQALLSFGAVVNARTKCGVTPLHFAAYEGNNEAIVWLLKYGADPDATAIDGSTPIIAAAFNSHARALSTLMMYRSSVDKRNCDGETALHYVVLRDKIDILRSLVSNRVDLEIQCRKAGSALHFAASQGSDAMVKLLLLSGSNPNQPFRYEGGYFEPPKDHGPDSELPWNQVGLKNKAPSEKWITIEDAWTPLHTAACGGHIDVVERLLDFGADISMKSGKGETPLHIASSSCLANIAEELLKEGSDVQAKTLSGDTPLHLAALALLANHNAHRRDRAKCGCTLRREAEQRLKHPDHSKSDCVQVLLKYGANVQALNAHGLTPFLVAVQTGNEEVCNALLDYAGGVVENVSDQAYVAVLQQCGPDANARLLKNVCAIANRTPESDVAWNKLFLKACSAGNHELMALAVEQGVTWCKQPDSGPDRFLEAISKGHTAAVKMLLELGADPRSKDDAGCEALHLACRTAADEVGKSLFIDHMDKSSHEMARQLLDHGAQVNAKLPNGDTALHLAVVTGNLDLTALLIKSGASVNIRNNHGQTPLHAATRKWVFPEIVKRLLQENACPSAQDHEGCTPLHYIRDKSKEGHKVVELLMEHGCQASIRARNGDMAHHRAGKRGEWDIVKQLMQTENLVHTKGFRGRSILHIAARRGDRNMAESFVQRGASWAILDDLGKSPRDYLKL